MNQLWKRILAAITCTAMLIPGTPLFAEESEPAVAVIEAVSAEAEIPAVEDVAEPAEAPVPDPTEAPTEEITEVPTEAPAEIPAEEDAQIPAEETTEAPAEVPTEEPAELSTEAPAEEPTEEPSEEPTAEPTLSPAEQCGMVVADWISQLDAREYSDDYHRALWLYKQLISAAKPDADGESTAEDALLGADADSRAYALAYALLMDAAGLDNTVIHGETSWNAVKMDGSWYHVDAFADDAARDTGAHFGLTDGAMARDHEWNTSDAPACSAVENNYFVREENYIPYSTTEELSALLAGAAAEETEFLQLYYAGRAENYSIVGAASEVLPALDADVQLSGREDGCLGELHLVYTVPTEEPTAVPTEEPTAVPTEVPTAVPTEEPTAVPTEEPTAVPTEEPTAVPTEEPTAVPTEVPTAVPTEIPTEEPTVLPTEIPTEVPTAIPTELPTEEPTAVPTEEPVPETVEVPELFGVVPADTATAIIPVVAKLTLGVGETYSIANWETEPAGIPLTVSYKSSSTKYATVSADGMITAKRAGKSVITIASDTGLSCTISVTVKKAPKSISLATDKTILGVGETAQLTASIPSGYAGSYRFSSADPSKLSVDANGQVTAHAAGDVKVTVTTFNGKTKSGTIRVMEAPSEVILSHSEASVGAEDSWTIGYKLNDGAAGDVTFSSSDETIATVDHSGKITALKQGTATITAKTYNDKTATCTITVTPAPSGVTLHADYTTLGVGEKLQLVSEIDPEGTMGTLTYSSSNKKYVSVDANGVITASRTGSATITVKTYNGKTDSLKFTVKKAPKSISLATDKTILGVGETAQLTASIPSGYAGSYRFSSADPSKLSVDANGQVTAHAAGDVKVSVTTFNGKTKSGTIRVMEAPSEVILSHSEASVGAEDSWTIGYKLNDGAAGDVTFSSSDETIATVDHSGKITALKQGTATITAKTYNDKTATCTITVTPAPSGVTLHADYTTLGVGEKLQLVSEIDPEGTMGTLTYSSSNKKYVSVDANGMITASRTGSATITVKTYNGKTDSLKFTVKKAPKSISLATDKTILGVGETAQLTASIPSGYAGSYRFSSADPSKLSVDANGQVTAHAAGDVKVSVTTFNGKTKSGTIRVMEAPSEVILSHSEASVGAEDSWTIGYKLNDGAAGDVTFSSSDETVATVDHSGKISALKQGTATITAKTYNDKTATCTITVTPAPSGVTLHADYTTLGVGEKLQLVSEIDPEGTMGTLTYSSSNKKYVSVNADGMITASRTGSATITVKTYNGKTDSLKITVKKAPKSISLATDKTILGVGETAQLTASIPSGYAGSYRFSSADPSKLSVDANGQVTAHAAGDVKVSVTTFNGKTKSGTIRVMEAPSSVTITPSVLSLGPGDTLQLHGAVNAEAAGSIHYTSSHPEIVAVDTDTGVITGVAIGTATITAKTYNDKTATATVEVKPHPTYVKLPYTTLSIGIGDTIRLNPEIDPGTATTFSYSSSSTKFATVDASGVITAKRTGNTTIKVKTSNDLSFSLKVTVKKAPSSVKITPDNMVLGVYESGALSYSLTSNTAATVRYTSLQPEIATVTEDGVVTGISKGTATIRATTHNGKSDDCTVTIASAPSGISASLPATMGVGMEKQMAVTLQPADSHTSLRYEAVGDAVTVDANGMVKAVKPGNATIMAYTHIDGLYAQADVTVKPAPTKLKFSAAEYVVNMDEPLQLQPLLEPADCATEITYTPAKDNFFSVDANGLITPIMRGSCNLLVKTHNGLSITLAIRVVDPHFPENIAFKETPPTYMNVGETFKPEITVFPATALASMVWKSDNPSIATVNSETGEVTAESYGKVVIEGVSSRNPALSLSYRIVVLNPERCLTMPARRTDTGSISKTQAQIRNIRASAYLELDTLKAKGEISSSDYNRRKGIIEDAFNMHLFPWMTSTVEPYWKASNSEGGLKDYKPGTVYYGLPYTQNNRRFNVKKAVDNGYFTNSGKGYYNMQGSKFADRAYPGNDCSSYVSMSIWGMDHDHSFDSTRSIATADVYRKLTSTKELRPGDILNKSASHVVMFLYYANEEKTQIVIIEQGGGEAGTNTISCSLRDISYYTSKGYTGLRLKSLG